jgi:glycine/serine hydroxymethyltransferase
VLKNAKALTAGLTARVRAGLGRDGQSFACRPALEGAHRQGGGAALEKAHITVNKTQFRSTRKSRSSPATFRIGSPAVTTTRQKEADMDVIAAS